MEINFCGAELHGPHLRGDTLSFAVTKQKIHKVKIAQFRMDIKMKKFHLEISPKGIVVSDSFAECANKSLIFNDSFLFCFGDKRAKKKIPIKSQH